MPRGTFFSLAAAFASGLIQPRNPDVVLAALSRMRKVEIDGFLYKGRANKSSLLEGREFFFFFFFFFYTRRINAGVTLVVGGSLRLCFLRFLTFAIFAERSIKWIK